MKLWMSSEMQSDLMESYPAAERAIEHAVNDFLRSAHLQTEIRKWAHIAIILPWDHHEDYPEVQRKHSRDKSLEFRLDIDHGEFLRGTPADQQRLILDSLARCIPTMEKFGIDETDRAKLNAVLDKVRESVPLQPLT